MKKNFNFNLKLIDGEDIKDEHGVLTAKRAVVTALSSGNPDKPIPIAESIARWELGNRIQAAEDDVELTPDEIVKLKNALEAHYAPPVIVGQMGVFLNK